MFIAHTGCTADAPALNAVLSKISLRITLAPAIASKPTESEDIKLLSETVGSEVLGVRLALAQTPPNLDQNGAWLVIAESDVTETRSSCAPLPPPACRFFETGP